MICCALKWCIEKLKYCNIQFHYGHFKSVNFLLRTTDQIIDESFPVFLV